MSVPVPSMLTGIIVIGAFSSAYVVLHVSDTVHWVLMLSLDSLSPSFAYHIRVYLYLGLLLLRYRSALCPERPRLKHKPSFMKNFPLSSNAVMHGPCSFHCTGLVCRIKCILALNSLPFVYSSVSQTFLAGRRRPVYCFTSAITV